MPNDDIHTNEIADITESMINQLLVFDATNEQEGRTHDWMVDRLSLKYAAEPEELQSVVETVAKNNADDVFQDEIFGYNTDSGAIWVAHTESAKDFRQSRP